MTAPLIPGLFDGPTVEMRRSPVSEPVRLAASAQRVLQALREARGGWLANHELATPEIGGLRAVGRIDELRTAGHNIEKRHVKGGCWQYRIVERGRQ